MAGSAGSVPTVEGLHVEITTPAGLRTISGVTVSIGVAPFRRHDTRGTDLTTLLRVADGELYRAKDAGRNTVRVCSPPATSAADDSTTARTGGSPASRSRRPP